MVLLSIKLYPSGGQPTQRNYFLQTFGFPFVIIPLIDAKIQVETKVLFYLDCQMPIYLNSQTPKILHQMHFLPEEYRQSL